MARPFIWLSIVIFSFATLSLHAQDTVDYKEYALNKAFEKSMKNKDFEKALAEITELIELDASNKKYRYNQGQVYMMLEDYENAAKSYQYSQQSAYTNLQEDSNLAFATSQIALQNLEPAIETLTKLLKKNPNHKIARQNLEVALAMQQASKKQENNDTQQSDNNQEDTKNEQNQSEPDASDDNSGNENEPQTTPSETDPAYEDLDKQKTLELLQLLAPDEDEVRRKYLQQEGQKVTKDNDW